MVSNAPRFIVVVWVKKTDAFPELRDELIGLAAVEPDESTHWEGMVDFHWGFGRLEEAEHVAEALMALGSRPELVLLKVTDYENPKRSITFKDERKIQG